MSEDDQPAPPRTKVCEICGQTFDVSDLDQVFHHDSNPHEQLED